MLWKLLLLSFAVSIKGDIFYVSEECPKNSTNCNSLNFYASNFFPHSTSNDVTLYLTNGTHYLNTSIIINEYFNVIFQGMGEMREAGMHENVMEYPTQVICSTANTGIIIKSTNNIMISNITIKSCGASLNEEYVPQINTTAIIASNVPNITIQYVSIQDTLGQAIFFIYTQNIKGSRDITIFHSSFFNNNQYFKMNTSAIDFLLLSSANDSKLAIDHVNITNAHAGINITFVNNEDVFNISLQSLLVINTEQFGVVIIAGTCFYNIEAEKLFMMGNYVGWIFVQLACTSGYDQHVPHISISQSEFIANRYQATELLWYGLSSTSVVINSTRFYNNTGLGSTALYLARLALVDGNDQPEFDINLYNVTFDNNKYNLTLNELSGINPTFYLTSALSGISASYHNCTFSNNNGTALFLYNSRATFFGDNFFINNTGYEGGAMLLVTNSLLILQPDAHVSFINNHAIRTGGAIQVTQLVFQTRNNVTDYILGYCFYQLAQTESKSREYFYFENNTAGVAGSIIYGGITSLCYVLNSDGTPFTLIFSNISTIVNQSGNSIISSNGRGVCFCEGSIYNCSQKTITRQVSPGDTIDFSVVIVGQHDNTTTGFINIYDNDMLNRNQNLLNASCAVISQIVNVASDQINEIIYIHITVVDSSNYGNVASMPLTINIEVQPCRYGAVFLSSSRTCVCKPDVISATIYCNATSGIVTTEQINWIGYLEESDCTIVSNICPYDYCDLYEVSFPVDDPDLQCNYNRSGILCGQCADNFSLVLGSNECQICDTNAYFLLIVPFALAGIFLVVLLIALNLTVSVGTINGVIFFANILRIYNLFLFGSIHQPVLFQFISWINLDLGIQTCFISGMDSCTKIGLQFIFPFYIWFLIAIIIFVSHYSVKLSKAIGNNAISVLATLLLLSYTKLLRTIITIFTFTDISCQDEYGNDTFARRMWHFDPNINFWQSGCHLALFIIALAILIVLVVPYTLFLLLFPLLELIRSRQPICTKLYLKLKPFFDAYAGPHNDYFRFWPGLLLVLRAVIAITIVISGDVNISSSVTIGIILVLILILSSGYIYNNRYIHILEVFYLLLLYVIIHLEIAVYSGSPVESAVIGIPVVAGFSFLLFIGIIVFHFYKYFKPFLWIKERVTIIINQKKVDNVKKESEETTPAEEIAKIPQVRRSEVVLSELREPLLDDCGINY